MKSILKLLTATFIALAPINAVALFFLSVKPKVAAPPNKLASKSTEFSAGLL